MSELRKYAVGDSVQFPLIDFGASDFEATPVTFVAGDVRVSINGGAFANTTNLATHLGLGLYQLVLIGAEITGKLILVSIKDQSVPKTWEDQAVAIETYGHASAQHQFDLNAPKVTVLVNEDKSDYLLSAASRAAVVDEVHDEVRADHTAAGSFGQGVASVQGSVTGNVNGTVASVVGSVGGNVVGTIGDLAAAAKASVNAEVDTALADIFLHRFITQASTVVDGAPAANNFDTGLSGAVANDFYKGLRLKFVAGSLAGQVRDVASSVGSDLTFGDPFTAAPANGDAFVLLPNTAISISAAGFWDELEGVEPAVAIASNATFRQIFQHLKRRFYNNVTQTNSLQTVHKDDSITPLDTMVVSDDNVTQRKGKAS